MDFKAKEAKKNIEFFLARWGRCKPPPLISPPKVPPPAMPIAKKVKKVKPKGKVRNRPIAIPPIGQVIDGCDCELCVGFGFTRKAIDYSKPLSNGYSYGAWLNKRGYKKLGSGAYSTIYGKDGSDKVFKVTAGSQDNWIDYIQWSAKKGYCGSFAPRVYSWKKYTTKDNSEFSVSIVERMSETIDQANKSDAYLVNSLLYPAMKGHTLAACYMEDIIPGSMKFFKDLQSEFPKSNDLYGKNMMIRSDGSFCVTDPVCGQSTLKINRLRSKDLSVPAPAIRTFIVESNYRHRRQRA